MFDKTKPNGVLKKVMDVSLAEKYGWKSKIGLNDAIQRTYNSFKKEKINWKKILLLLLAELDL